jgi:hypothetical protein
MEVPGHDLFRFLVYLHEIGNDIRAREARGHQQLEHVLDVKSERAWTGSVPIEVNPSSTNDPAGLCFRDALVKLLAGVVTAHARRVHVESGAVDGCLACQAWETHSDWSARGGCENSPQHVPSMFLRCPWEFPGCRWYVSSVSLSCPWAVPGLSLACPSMSLGCP